MVFFMDDEWLMITNHPVINGDFHGDFFLRETHHRILLSGKLNKN
jgi:hypothetical protein